MAKIKFDISSEVKKDARLVKMLDYDFAFEDLLNRFCRDEFLKPDEYMEIPFFAQTRDYIGAVEQDQENAKWLVKEIPEEEEKQFLTGMIAYFINFKTGNTCAPTVLTRIGGKIHRATKFMLRTEQLSGAPYLENKRMRDQLAWDLINSWVFFDEDRNPNNYLIYYTLGNFPVVIAIDYSNIDLETKTQKIVGAKKKFGWERPGKTRYMTPLKTELFFNYNWDFFEPRFQAFEAIDSQFVEHVGEVVFQNSKIKGKSALIKTVAENIVSRKEYIHEYFKSWFGDEERMKKIRERTTDEMRDEYSIMGNTFNDMNKEFEN
jgi:hypothetical protein